MITLSEIVVISLLEAFAILVLAVVLLLFFNHRLHKKGATLAAQLHQLKDTTQYLINKVNAFTENSYASFLVEAVATAKSDAESVFDDSDLKLEPNSSQEQKAAKLRYLLLDAELNCELESNETERLAVRHRKLQDIVSDIEQNLKDNQHPDDDQQEQTEVLAEIDGSSIDEGDLKQKWGYLCDAAISLVSQRTLQSEEDLIDILRVINTDLDLGDITLPNKQSLNSNVLALKEESDHSRDIISKLLSERNAAEAEVNVKATELERLARFLKESEWCIKQLEQDLLAAQQSTLEFSEDEAQGNSSQVNEAQEEEIADMKNLINRFTQESSEMLMCIETLEQENSSLKNQLGLG